MPLGAITVTATADTGPAQQVTAQVIQNVNQLLFDYQHGVLTVYADNYYGTFQLSNISGVTVTPASRTLSFTDA